MLGILLAAWVTGGQDARSVELPLRERVAIALREPMLDGLDVEQALAAWFLAKAEQDSAQRAAWYERALGSLESLSPLPQASWKPIEKGTRCELLETLPNAEDGISSRVVRFEVDGLTQYGLVTRATRFGDAPLPLVMFVHGAAFGVPLSTLGWQAEMARLGYVVAAPAFRGEPAFYPEVPGIFYQCDGEIENLAGEPRDVLALADGMRQLPFVRGGKFAIAGHSFGAGAGLLAAARSPEVACVVSYDAWLVNPFHFYWLRLSGAPSYYWGSWEAYCEQSISKQLAGLMTRSIGHHADRLRCPVQIFIGQLDASGYHTSHEHFVGELKRHKREYDYHVIPEGGHNFVLYRDQPPARAAWALQVDFMKRHFPPGPVSKPQEEGAR